MFVGARLEGLGEGDAVGVANELKDLVAQSAMAEGAQALFELGVVLGGLEAGVLGFEGFAVAEGIFVDEGDEAVEFEEGVLKWGGGEEDFAGAVESGAKSVGGFVLGFVNVA